jgi:hypothetical protein
MKIEMTHVVEEEGGEMRYFFDMDRDTADRMAEVGLKFALVCAVSGVDPEVALDSIMAMAAEGDEDD